jgi:tetratricopeptide (TPR) repeat protein
MKRDWVNGMNWMHTAAWVGASLVVTTIAGCAGSKPVQFSESSVESSNLTQPSVSIPPASSGAEHARNYHSQLADTMNESEAETPLQKANATLRKATDSIKETLTISPKVVPAPDPLALNNSQESINPTVFFSLAGFYESQGKLDLAVQQYKKGLDVDPSNVNGWIKFARMYDRQGDYRQAQMAYRRVLELSPDHPTALNDLGLCHARHGDFEQAMASLQRAVSISPNKKLYRNNIATALVASGRHDDALQHLQAVHAPAAAQYNLAVLLLKERREALAVAHLQQALQVDPNLVPARQLLDGLRRNYASGPQPPVATAANPYAQPSQRSSQDAWWQPGQVAPGRQPAAALGSQQNAWPQQNASTGVRPTNFQQNSRSPDAYQAEPGANSVQQPRLLPPTGPGAYQ